MIDNMMKDNTRGKPGTIADKMKSTSTKSNGLDGEGQQTLAQALNAQNFQA